MYQIDGSFRRKMEDTSVADINTRELEVIALS